MAWEKCSSARSSKDAPRRKHAGLNPAIKARLAYLGKPEEQFARDYSHYVALKSGSAPLLSQIRKERADVLQYGHYAYRTDEEMKKVVTAFDKILGEKSGFSAPVLVMFPRDEQTKKDPGRGG
jgi:hypothetical protein